jgi:C1A family cysteine protease
MPLPKYHWTRDKVDKRDHTYASKQLGAIPTKIDLRANCSPIENQGNLGSCTGNAIAATIEYLYKKAKKPIDVSRLFIYYEERALIGTISEDSGAFIRDGIKVVNKKGAPLENLWPYNISKFTYRPSQSSYVDAAKRKAVGYQRCLNFNAVKNALAVGYPVVIGFDVYESFESQVVANTGQMPFPNVDTEECLGGHAVTLVGYDDATQKFIARNSWGAGWGDRGYFYMPYQVIQDSSMSSDFWIITSVTVI